MADICFEKMFRASECKPIEYKGKFLHIADKYEIKSGDRFKVILEQFNSEWRQGVSMILPNGSFRLCGKESGRQIVLWQHSAPRVIDNITLFMKRKNTGVLHIINVWDPGDGIMDSGHNGAAMYIEDLGNNRKRYWCNDGYPDDDLNDIVFSIEKRKIAKSFVCGKRFVGSK